MSHRGHPSQTTTPNALQRSITGSTPSTRRSSLDIKQTPPPEDDDFSDWDIEDQDQDEDEDEMDDRRPPLHRPTDGRSHQPLLPSDLSPRGRSDISPERPPLFSRRSTMRSRSPDTQAKLATRKKYTYAAFFLGLSLISFVIQTETAVYIQHELHWDKAYCML